MFAHLIGQGLEASPQKLEVRKYLLDGSLKMQYWAELIGATQHERLIHAIGNFDQQIIADFWLREGDEYIEWYSSLKGYNILEIHDQPGGQIKFWYCNLCRPARFIEQAIIWTDLALDLLVTPEKQFMLLDQDELTFQKLDWETYSGIWRNLGELLEHFRT
ncbi:MAG: DUF402 domain-containing protein [Bacteroidales bacterium]